MTTYFYIDTVETTDINDVISVNIDQLASIFLGLHPNDLHKRFNLEDDFKGDESAALDWLFEVDARSRSSAHHLVATSLEALTKDLNAFIANIEAE